VQCNHDGNTSDDYTQLQTLRARGGSKQTTGTKVWQGNLVIEKLWVDGLMICAYSLDTSKGLAMRLEMYFPTSMLGFRSAALILMNLECSFRDLRL
jgi:hypothetical protein